MVDQFKKYMIVTLALAAAIFTRFFLISVYKIPTDSMTPTLLAGDYIIASQISYGLKFPWSQSVWFKESPKKGDLIVFSFKAKPSISYLKRIVGIEGDEVKTPEGTVKIGPNQVYVLSDNTEALNDSRDLGMVAVEEIEAKAQRVWLSFSESNEIRWNRIFSVIK